MVCGAQLGESSMLQLFGGSWGEFSRGKLTFDSNTEARRCCCNSPSKLGADDDPTATDCARRRRTGTCGELALVGGAMAVG